jgi:hypothetical protein
MTRSPARGPVDFEEVFMLFARNEAERWIKRRRNAAARDPQLEVLPG